jgi:hypothetical protein
MLLVLANQQTIPCGLVQFIAHAIFAPALTAYTRMVQVRKAAAGGLINDSTVIPIIHTSLTMSTQIKTRINNEGMRWIRLCIGVKGIENGTRYLPVLLFDDEFNLVAISTGTKSLIPRYC